MKALVVCTNTGVFPTKGTKTGLWLGELAHFYDVLSKKKIGLELASPLGGVVPIDPRSLESKDEVVKRYCQDENWMSRLKSTRPLEDVDPSEYKILYLVGGHGAMWDFPENPLLQKLIAAIYDNYGTLTAVGHGVSALLNVQLADGSWLVGDRYITGFSNTEEKLASFVCEVPFYLEDKLLERKAHFTSAMIPFTEHIELDERLITGQNPNSARKVAQKLLEELWEK